MVEFQILGQHLHLETPIITSEPMIKTIVLLVTQKPHLCT